jgi:hypothetical protein
MGYRNIVLWRNLDKRQDPKWQSQRLTYTNIGIEWLDAVVISAPRRSSADCKQVIEENRLCVCIKSFHLLQKVFVIRTKSKLKILNFSIRINIWEMPVLSLCRINGYSYWNYVVVFFNYSKEIAKCYQDQAMNATFKSSKSPTTRQYTFWITDSIAKCQTRWKHHLISVNWGNSACVKIFERPSV